MDLLEEDIIGYSPTPIPPNPLQRTQMTTYDKTYGFIVCLQDCYSWKEPAEVWTLMSISLPYKAYSGSQVNLADGRIWIIGGRWTPTIQCKVCNLASSSIVFNAKYIVLAQISVNY